MKTVKPCLMFVGPQHGKAEEAIRFYAGLFARSEVTALERYAGGDGGPKGTVKTATFTLNGIELMAMDSALPHPFGFTPAISLFVECESAEEQERTFAALAEGGFALMPLGAYGFSRRFGWVQDRYGVTWQLNLE